MLEHLHFHQYHCEGRQITDDKELRFTEGLEIFWEDFSAEKIVQNE